MESGGDKSYDVIIVGASFSGLALAHHLPRSLGVLIVDAKPAAGASVESTGLITQKTRDEFASFFDIDRHITNPITAICVVATDFGRHFVSKTNEPWIYQTDTKSLVRALADALPSNVELKTSTMFLGVNGPTDVSAAVLQSETGERMTVPCRVLVGADGGRSKVAESVSSLDRSRRFLFGYEQVLRGRVHLGPEPESTVYHFWFGEFSLGYGGWLSPTTIGGQPGFRIGLAKKMKDRGDAKALTGRFLQELIERKIVSLDEGRESPEYVFGGAIPIGGALRSIVSDNVFLVGDAAGFCGAFAADGIKGSVVSGKEVASLIAKRLEGGTVTSKDVHLAMERHGGLMDYYGRQVRYRFIWDLMRRNRTFDAMYKTIEAEQDSFLEQFCDSKDKRKSLIHVVIKPRHIFRLMRYAWNLAVDFALRPFQRD